MKVLPLGIALVVAFAACKPLAKREPASTEQSALSQLVHLQSIFRKAISKGDIDKASTAIADKGWSFLKVKKAVEEATAKGHSKQVHELIANYRVTPPAALNNSIETVKNTFNLGNFFASLEGLKIDIRKVFLDFKKLEAMIKHSDLASTSADNYVTQLKRLQTDFDDWADPILEEINTIVDDFYVPPGEISEYEGMQIFKKLMDETSAIKDMLKTEFWP